MAGNPKLGPTFSHDILQYWDKHSQLFMLNFQHEISILGTKKSQTRPKIFPWYLPTLGWTFPMYDINFPTSFMKLYFPMKFQKPPKHTPALGNKFPWLGYELGNFLKIPNYGTGYFFPVMYSVYSYSHKSIQCIFNLIHSFLTHLL